MHCVRFRDAVQQRLLQAAVQGRPKLTVRALRRRHLQASRRPNCAVRSVERAVHCRPRAGAAPGREARPHVPTVRSRLLPHAGCKRDDPLQPVQNLPCRPLRAWWQHRRGLGVRCAARYHGDDHDPDRNHRHHTDANHLHQNWHDPHKH